ncbi:hypothetical protein FB45DRAFT_873441 [Roridomyces roridus]|uniref:F-box domain-containing protein n=1 Tax=Roridomyces roridus TaxID=1738132 RepID=A0AAD7BAM2_9AGAR|nr:hypothetical protein FB45DRAFT_873441 [Roridomyces roridus]
MSGLLRSLRRKCRKSPPATPILPLELQFQIIDDFTSDVPTLHDLCRVSRSWAAHAQSILFRSVTIKWHNWLTLLEHLKANPHLGTHVVSLRVWGQIDVIGPALADHMPNLRELDVQDRLFGRIEVVSPAKCASIVRLRLDGRAFADTETMFSFLSRFVHLKSLEISRCPIKEGVPLNAGSMRFKRMLHPPWNLNYLALDEYPQSAIVQWLLSSNEELVVDHLRILARRKDASALNALLRKIGGSIRRLDLPSTFLDPPNTFDPFIFVNPPVYLQGDGTGGYLFSPSLQFLNVGPADMIFTAHCIALEHLTFHERLRGHPILAQLSQLSSTHHSSLSKVSFTIHSDDDCTRIAWNDIDGLLAGNQFPRLERVVFDVLGAELDSGYKAREEGEVRRIIELGMPVLRNRGVLEFF